MSTVRIGLLVAMCLACGQASAALVTIADLYNTGVDSAGVALPDGSADPHWAITSGGGLIATVTPAGFPIPPWAPNDVDSKWIGTQFAASDAPNAAGVTFSTSFTIGADADLSTVVINGAGGSDDAVVNTILNGVSIGALPIGGFSTLKPFTISSGFVHGANSLDIVVFNSTIPGTTNPLGLRIDDIVGSYQTVSTVPTPTSVALLLLGLVLGGRRLVNDRRRA